MHYHSIHDVTIEDLGDSIVISKRTRQAAEVALCQFS